MRRTLTAVLLALVTALGLVSTATPANARPHQAATTGSSGGYSLGYTQVDIDPAVAALVIGAGITPAPIGGASAFVEKGTLAARFPITGFDFFRFSLKHRGGLSLSKGSASISLSDFSIDLARAKVSAVVVANGATVGRVDVFDLAFSRRPDLGLIGLTLTGTAAGALNATFGVSAFAAGATFGYATPRPFASSYQKALQRGGVSRYAR